MSTKNDAIDPTIVVDSPGVRQTPWQALAGVPGWIISKASTDGALALLSLARHNFANRQPLTLSAWLLRAVGTPCVAFCARGVGDCHAHDLRPSVVRRILRS